jgi:hypothetical protein
MERTVLEVKVPTKVVCWNINKRKEPWRQLLRMDADIALLQEAGAIRCGWQNRHGACGALGFARLEFVLV